VAGKRGPNLFLDQSPTTISGKTLKNRFRKIAERVKIWQNANTFYQGNNEA
jgi:hypothetical protein